MPSQLTTRYTPVLRRKRTAGFTLVEMAVVVVIMAIALTMGLRLLQATQESAAWSETKIKQERIKVSLISFLRTNGRLPCPNAVAPWDGAEDSPCLGNLGRGVVPWQALGLSVADVQDGWANFFTYRVANRTPLTSSNWTITTGPAPFSINELTNPTIALTVQARDATGALGAAVSPSPVVVIVSHGKNGGGARTIRGTLNAAVAGAADEAINANAATTTFISRTPSDVSASAGGIFDDLVTYMTPRDLLQPLVDDKTLKGSTAAFYREQGLQQVALISCTPPLVAPSLLAIQPTIGNGAVTYTCPVSASYSCRTATPVSNAATAGAKQLYQLSTFGAPPLDVTYANLQAAFPGVATRCP